MKLVERMPRVCKAVIKAKDGYLKNLKYKIFDLYLKFFLVTTCAMCHVLGSGPARAGDCH